MRARRLLALAVLVLGLGACAYFNALYNARRLYTDAQRAAERGDVAAAERDHRESLEKAARSLRSDPTGRWADDALLLVGQNQFALGDCDASHAALQRVVDTSDDPELVAHASAYLGAAQVCLETPDSALRHLDHAVERLEGESATHALARLWRARALFALDSAEAAWGDLEHASRSPNAVGREATLEQIAMALHHDEPPAAVAGLRRMLSDPEGDLFTDSLITLSRAASDLWGGEVVREALAGAGSAPWPGEQRDRLAIVRARQAAVAGDTATAFDELSSIASGSALGPATAARLETAELMLARATSASDLDAVRALLLPALSHPRARPLVQSIATIGALLEFASTGQPLAFFAAAEVARDRLAADALAGRLFQTYADVVGASAWGTKALLAALALEPEGERAEALRRRIASAGDPYAVAASTGGAAVGFEDSELRLQASLAALTSDADARVRNQDVAVGSAIAEFDSVAAVARADSVQLACGSLIDSLGVGGVRRDSVRAACVRGEFALVDSFLVADTTLLMDSVAAAAAERESLPPPNAEERPQ